MATVKLPMVGTVDQKWVWIGGAGTLGIIGALWWRHNQQKKAAQASQQGPQGVYVAGQTGIDPAGNEGVIDPATGYVYGTPEDQAALGDLAVQNYASAALYTPAQYTPLPGREGSGGGGRFGNNAAWVRAAVGALSATYNKQTVETALDAVLAGLTVTTRQKDIFLEAVALEGQPPDGYPKPIHTSDTPSQPHGIGHLPPHPHSIVPPVNR